MLAKPEHEIAYQELTALVAKHADKLSSLELLAIAANMLGKIIAMQDQKTMTADQAMLIVQKNLELGNKQVLDELFGKTAGNA